MVEQQPGIFKEVSNQVDVIEKRTAVCRPLVDQCLIPVAVAVSWALAFSVYLPCHHHHRRTSL
jgi:hypothetical protein